MIIHTFESIIPTKSSKAMCNLRKTWIVQQSLKYFLLCSILITLTISFSKFSIWWVNKSLILALGRQRQTGLSGLKARLVYRTSSKAARTVIQRNTIMKNKNKKIQTKKLLFHNYYNYWSYIKSYTLPQCFLVWFWVHSQNFVNEIYIIRVFEIGISCQEFTLNIMRVGFL